MGSMTATTDRPRDLAQRPTSPSPTSPTSPARTALRAARRYLPRLGEALVTPLVPADYLDLIDPMRAGADLRGRIVAVTPQTRDAVTLTIRPGRDWRGHTPGQYVRIGVDVDGVRHWRAYSLTHDATRSLGTIDITVKAIPDGVVSTHLVRHASVGMLVHLDQATGDFVLPIPAPRATLFLTAGSGITPVIGMLRNRVDLVDVVHVHLAPSAADVVFADELEAYAATGRLTLVRHHDDERGLFDLADLDTLVPDWREREVWACGPTGLLDAAEAHWGAAGVGQRLHVERFRTSVLTPGEGGAVTFSATGVTVDADGSTPLLDTGEAAGVLMPSGCRMGICFGCVSTLREGAVLDLRTGELTSAEDGAEVSIQTCVSAAAGPCEIVR